MMLCSDLCPSELCTGSPEGRAPLITARSAVAVGARQHYTQKLGLGSLAQHSVPRKFMHVE
jgi:hypothetical protein